MSLTCDPDHLGSKLKLEMEIDEQPGGRNDEPFNPHPTIFTKNVDSILLIEVDSNESSFIMTIEEPTEKNDELNGNIEHNFGSCNSNSEDILKSCADQPVSSCPNGHSNANERSAALSQKDAPPIVESTGDLSSSSSCESDGDSISNFPTSSLNSTADGSYHACTVPGCRKMFSRPSRLLQHSRIHTGERPYMCPEVGCGRSYTRSQHLLRHTQIAHSAPVGDQSQHASTDNKCDKCGKQFVSIYSLRKHLSQYHERRKYSCSECGQVFLKQQHMRSHSQIHSNEPAFSCDVPGCTASFYLPSKLQRHKLLHVPGRYKCTRDPTCKQVFDRHVDLRRHLASQHPFVCTICRVEFTEQGRYNRHRATHEDLRLTYYCTKPGCGRCYYSLRALTSHIRDSHEQRVPQHECVVCTKRFATKQKLQQHLKTHGPDCGRVVKKVAVKKRMTRCDKGLGRTDYRSLLSGLTPGKQPPERLDHSNNRKAVEISRRTTGESNPEIETPLLVGMDKVLGTRRLLEGSAVARHEFVKTRQSNISNSISLNTEGRNRIKGIQACETVLRQPLVSSIKLREVMDSVTVKPGPFDIREELNEGSDQGSKPKANISTYSESDKIGSVFISGQGAIKQSRVILARLSERVVDMLDNCNLAGSGK